MSTDLLYKCFPLHLEVCVQAFLARHRDQKNWDSLKRNLKGSRITKGKTSKWRREGERGKERGCKQSDPFVRIALMVQSDIEACSARSFQLLINSIYSHAHADKIAHIMRRVQNCTWRIKNGNGDGVWMLGVAIWHNEVQYRGYGTRGKMI